MRAIENKAFRAGAGAVRDTVLLTALMGCFTVNSGLRAQAPATAPAAANRVQGTVKTISGNSLTVTSDAGQTTVTVAPNARVQQSADLKTVSASSLDQVAVGDRVLAIGAPGDAGTFAASRLIVIKSEAIAQRNQASQADWARRGSGGIVTAVDPSANTISITSGARKITIDTTKSTIYRRYAPGSVKFEDAKASTLAEIQPGDQLRVRGDRAPDGTTITAEEIVSGAFKSLSATVVSVNASANTLVVKNLATKKNETISVGSDSDLRSLPPEMAARFAARSRPGAGGARTPGSDASQGGSAPRPAADGAAPAQADGGAGGRAGANGGYGAGGGYGRPGGAGSGTSGSGGAGGGRAGADLSQMIPRLPKSSLADLKPGEALMIVASGNSGGTYTAITVLSGVEPLLTGPAGSEPSLSPWSLGGGGGEGGAAE